MTVHTEAAFEDTIERHLALHGWRSLAPSGYDRALGLFPDELLAFIEESQQKEWEQLKLRLGGEGAARVKVVEHVAKQLDTRGAIKVLRGHIKMNGVTLHTCFFAPANTLTPDLLTRHAQVRCGVVRQLHHSESTPADSLDLALVVNGIPTATAELKNLLTHQGVEHAMAQYQNDRNPADLIFRARAFVHFAVDPHQVYMTTRLAKQQTTFLPFNQGDGGPGRKGGAGNPTGQEGHATAYLWEQVWERSAWLDIIGSFVHSSDRGVLFPRFHQWHAVRSIVAATLRDGVGTDCLVQHSAGSGKSNTIAWTARALSRLHDAGDTPVFDKVIVITDRVVLDRQLQETVAGLDHTPGTIVRIDKNSTQLREALEGHAARIIITTLQKFPVVADMASDVVGRSFAVIVDEAHSSTSGESIKELQSVLSSAEAAALAVESENGTVDGTDVITASAAARRARENLTYVAFTATPKPKTVNLFGQAMTDDPTIKEAFHLYSMRQAIEEGFILDVLASYTTYATYYKLATHAPDDPDVPVDKARAELVKWVSLHPSNLEAKARIVVEHFRAKTRGKINGQAKAMIVTRSREHAVRYKHAVDTYIRSQGYDVGPRALRALVAFSGSLTVDDVVYTEPMMNGFGEAALPARFGATGTDAGGEEYHLLVVADKYQTGFDQPLLHTMYVDRKLSGVRAVQTLSRLNRTRPGKTDTFVLDFANTIDEITDAFADFFEASPAVIADPNDVYNLQRRVMERRVLDESEMEAVVTALLSGSSTKQGLVYARLGRAVDRFRALDADGQEELRGDLTSYVRAYAFLSQVMTWTDRELERLYLFGKALLTQLPRGVDDPMPLVSDQVELTHLRVAATAEEENAALESGDDTPGEALPGGGSGRLTEAPVDKLSALVEKMNTLFGTGAGEGDRLWVEQQEAEVRADDELRVVALNNDRDAFDLVLGEKLPGLVASRQQENAAMFELFFNDPRFARVLAEYLGGVYDEFRGQAGA